MARETTKHQPPSPHMARSRWTRRRSHGTRTRRRAIPPHAASCVHRWRHSIAALTRRATSVNAARHVRSQDVLHGPLYLLRSGVDNDAPAMLVLRLGRECLIMCARRTRDAIARRRCHRGIDNVHTLSLSVSLFFYHRPTPCNQCRPVRRRGPRPRGGAVWRT